MSRLEHMNNSCAGTNPDVEGSAEGVMNRENELDPEIKQAIVDVRLQTVRAENLLSRINELPEGDALERMKLTERIRGMFVSFFDRISSIKSAYFSKGLPHGTGIAGGATVGVLFAALNVSNVSDFTLLDFMPHNDKLTKQELTEIGDKVVASKLEKVDTPMRVVVNVGSGAGYGLVLEGGVVACLKIVEALRRKKENDLPESV